MAYHLVDMVQCLGRPRILVLGDLILDRYVWGDAERVSQEAPVILLRQEQQEVRLGGAANVAQMLRGLEADVTVAGVTGHDREGDELRQHLVSAGVDCSKIVTDSSRPTTLKQRYIGRAQHRHPHQMLRVDREDRTPLDTQIAGELLKAVRANLDDFQAVLISDYAKGVCTPEVTAGVIAAAREAEIPVIVDPASSGLCRHYTGATAITPNRLETTRATGRDIRTPEDAFAAGRTLCADLKLDYVFATLDSDGIALIRADGSAELFPTRRREVYDITGAGDMVLATIGVGAADGIAPENLAQLANIAGGLEVEQIGVVTITRQEILADLMAGGRSTQQKMCGIDELSRHLDTRRKQGQRIVFTNGCFDLLHAGHVQYLEQAATLGNCLVVALNSDEGVRRHKGIDRPIIAEQYRARMLAALECVDHVIVFYEETPHTLLHRLQPDILVKGGTTEEVIAREVVEAYGGEVKVLDALRNFSTTDIVNAIRSHKNAA